MQGTLQNLQWVSAEFVGRKVQRGKAKRVCNRGVYEFQSMVVETRKDRGIEGVDG